MSNYFSKVFGTSPVEPIQNHMEVCFKASKKLVGLFEHAMAGKWDKVSESREEIVELERAADDLKKQIRAQLSRSMFMPVPRRDLLDLLLVQDRIANFSRDVSGLVFGRRMEIPAIMQDDFLRYVVRNVDAAKAARKSIRELDELYATGFQGAEAELVIALVEELDRVENDTDEMQIRVRNELFSIEKELPPIDVMFLYRVIELVGEIGDMAERIGRRLELLIAR